MSVQCRTVEFPRCVKLGRVWEQAIRLKQKDPATGDVSPWDASGTSWRVQVRSVRDEVVLEQEADLELVDGYWVVSWALFIDPEAVSFRGVYHWAVGYLPDGEPPKRAFDVVRGELNLSLEGVRWP